MIHLLSRYTSQHSRVCAVHLTLTLSNSGSPIRIFSLIKPLIRIITFKDMTWTQTLMSGKQVMKACRTLSSLGMAF